MAPKSNRQKQCKRIMEQQPRIMDARRRKAASSSEVCDECDLTDVRGARAFTACASVPVANASRTCFPTGQEPPDKTGAARDASAANKRARRAADQPHTADTPSPCEQLMARLNDASVRCAIDDVNVPSSSAGQPAPVEVLQTLLAASDRAADARHPRDAKHGQGRDARPVGRSHLSRTEHL